MLDKTFVPCAESLTSFPQFGGFAHLAFAECGVGIRCSGDFLRGAENGWIVAGDVGFDVGNVRPERTVNCCAPAWN